MAEAELADGLYAHWERDAVEHLFSVAGGLDSMVLGETQIQAQVREALRLADGEGAAGSRMQGLFHAASRAGRRIRQETSLGAAPDAFVERAASLAEDALGNLSGRSVVVIGAGTMASLSVKHLRRRGVGPIRILNRSLEHARSLAERHAAEPGDLDALPAALRGADVVVSATGATGVVVHADLVRATRPAERRRSCCWTWPCRATWSPWPVTSPGSPSSTSARCVIQVPPKRTQRSSKPTRSWPRRSAASWCVAAATSSRL